MPPSLDVTIDGPVAHLTLSRPEVLNALDDGTRRLLDQALVDLEARTDVRVIVLRGSGRAFSAGADLTTTAYPRLEGDWMTRRAATGTWQRVLERLDRTPQVTIAGLHGHVIGGAALLAAACDLRIAADDTVLRIPELALGLPLTWAGIPLLVREIGLPLTRDWVMTCRDVSSDELLRAGYAQRVVPAAGLDDEIERCVAGLIDLPPAPLAMTKAMTSAIGRSHPAMVAGWGDADLQMWSYFEDDRKQAARDYLDRTLRRRHDDG
jgi:enoyl-CoA hydratase/carnithine racemase